MLVFVPNIVQKKRREKDCETKASEPSYGHDKVSKLQLCPRDLSHASGTPTNQELRSVTGVGSVEPGSSWPTRSVEQVSGQSLEPRAQPLLFSLVELVKGAEHGPSRRTPTNQELRLVTGVGLLGVLELTPTNSVEPVMGVTLAGFLAATGSVELRLVVGITTPPLLLPTPQSWSWE